VTETEDESSYGNKLVSIPGHKEVS